MVSYRSCLNKILRNCVRVALVTLTHSVRVRILIPQPINCGRYRLSVSVAFFMRKTPSVSSFLVDRRLFNKKWRKNDFSLHLINMLIQQIPSFVSGQQSFMFLLTSLARQPHAVFFSSSLFFPKPNSVKTHNSPTSNLRGQGVYYNLKAKFKVYLKIYALR